MAKVKRNNKGNNKGSSKGAPKPAAHAGTTTSKEQGYSDSNSSTPLVTPVETPVTESTTCFGVYSAGGVSDAKFDATKKQDRMESQKLVPIYPNVASHPYNDVQQAEQTTSPVVAGNNSSPDEMMHTAEDVDAVTGAYLATSEAPPSAVVDNAHEKFVKECVSEPRAAADSTFRNWMAMFRDSPQVAQTVAKSYAAVVVARENRVTRMHDQFCKLLSKRLDVEAFYRTVREKCRAEVVKKYLQEKWESNRVFVQEKWESQRVAVQVWGEVCKKQQDEITKRLADAELTKRYFAGHGQKAAAFFAFLAVFATRSRDQRRRVVLLSALGYLLFHFRVYLRNKAQEIAKRNVWKTLLKGASSTVEASCDGVEGALPSKVEA
ncbi:unnamed protein product [Amoebophrya sp. A120]|nr:unnamed protein product [Amoebophrya sp. A120]|eukprot:GSA120T00018439001.1